VKDEVIVTNLGHPSRELSLLKGRELNFYMLGSLGQASSIGLGLALKCKKRRVLVLDRDESLLTNSSILATIATERPQNLTVFCLDNGTWGSTGGEPTRAYRTVDMELLAKAMGIEKTARVLTKAER
jgi:sulfopyruvate decarboxylase subunit beta